jgi:hypothetical protein
MSQTVRSLEQQLGSTQILRDGFKEVTAEIQRLIHIAEGEKEMVDSFPLRPNGWKLPEPEPDEEQEEQQRIVAEAVYNYHEDGKSKTIALKVTLQVPLQ